MTSNSDDWLGSGTPNPGASPAGQGQSWTPPVQSGPPLTPESERKTSAWCHFGPLVLGVIVFFLDLSIIGTALAWIGFFAFLIPVIIRQTSGKRSIVVKQNATESLNFQLTLLMVSLVLFLIAGALFATTIILGLAILPFILAVDVFAIVVMIKGGRAASKGELYKYPIAIRLIKLEMP